MTIAWSLLAAANLWFLGLQFSFWGEHHKNPHLVFAALHAFAVALCLYGLAS